MTPSGKGGGSGGSGGGSHPLLGLSCALLYAGTAVSMNFVNKATLEVFPLAWTVLFLQMVTTVLVILPLWIAHVVVFPPFSWAMAKQLMPITVFYTSNTAFALLGLQSMNIPMFSTLKRLTPMIVLLFKAIYTRSWPSRGTTYSVMFVVLGCVVAGLGDLTFHALGYMYALSSCCLQATYLLLVEFKGKERNVGSAEMLFYNGMLSSPFLLVMMLMTGESKSAVPTFLAASAARPVFPLLLASCSVLGTLLNLSLFLCTINNSALTTTIVGVLKGVVATVLGFFLLGGVQFNVINVIGIALNTLGGICYTTFKYKEKSRQAWAGQAGYAASQPLQIDVRTPQSSPQKDIQMPVLRSPAHLSTGMHLSEPRERILEHPAGAPR
mmetsp:Transcript_5475/g.14233  ORF Transcript_5475/g.14233 Transcript_5475/m.14233 type:complete len:382 (-) Transcript_5475:149-1294(-)|eukprot:jgi/Tetstr1/434643/TSEL_023734.t1